MPRSNQLAAFLAISICLFLVACSGRLVQSTPQTPQQSVEMNASQDPGSLMPIGKEDEYKVDIWLNKPNPLQGEVVILIGHLEKNGFAPGGIMMEASWPGEDQDRGAPSCYVMVNYQRAVCAIDTKNFSVGDTVPITVKFRYDGLVLTGDTSITVR